MRLVCQNSFFQDDNGFFKKRYSRISTELVVGKEYTGVCVFKWRQRTWFTVAEYGDALSLFPNDMFRVLDPTIHKSVIALRPTWFGRDVEFFIGPRELVDDTSLYSRVIEGEASAHQKWMEVVRRFSPYEDQAIGCPSESSLEEGDCYCYLHDLGDVLDITVGTNHANGGSARFSSQGVRWLKVALERYLEAKGNAQNGT